MTMPSNNPKIPKQTLGFLAITLAWLTTMIVASVYQVIRYGKTEDLQVIIFWSALFVFIAWLVFIVPPLAILRPSRKMFRIMIFPLITGCYAAAVYSLMIGILFPVGVIRIYIAWAILIGVLFGLVYSLLSSSGKLIHLLQLRPILKIFCALLPFILSGLVWWLFPILAPRLSYRFMPEPIQMKIVISTLPKFRQGDRFSSLRHALPGYFDEVGSEQSDSANYSTGSWSGGYGDYEYLIEVSKDTIRKLDFRRSQ